MHPESMIMKTITTANRTLIIVLLLSIQMPLFGQTQKQADSEQDQPQYIATIKRSTSGEKLNERGFGAGSVSLKSGMTYPVEKQDMGFVTIRDGDVLVKVSKSDVELAEDEGSAAEGGFFRIVSANYQATTGGRRYSVKQEISAFSRQLLSFVTFVQTGVEPYDFHETIELMAILIAAEESAAREGAVIDLPDFLDKMALPA